MEVLLRVEDETPGVGPRSRYDVVVHLDDVHTGAELQAAIAAALGRASTSLSLRRRAGDELIDPAATVAQLGLRSGETIVVAEPGRHTRSVATCQPTEPVPAVARLVVTAGPDVGREHLIGPTPVRVGRDRSCELRLDDPLVGRHHATFGLRNGQLVMVPTAEAADGVRVDGRPVRAPARVRLRAGRVVRLGASALLVAEVDRARLDDGGAAALPDAGAPLAGQSRRWSPEVAFHRTPYYPDPVQPVTFEPLGIVPDPPEPVRFAVLAALAPLLMGVVLAVVYSPRFLVFAVFSPVVAAAGYVENRRRNARRYRTGEDRYRRRLAERRQEIVTALVDERRRRVAAAPSLAELATRAETADPELWVRGRRAPDVLVLRHGLGPVTPAVTVEPERRGDDVLRAELAETWSSLLSMDDVPITVDHREHPVVALVGQSADIGELAASLVVQAACLHSPEDVVVAAAVGPDRPMTAWLRWLPHTRAASAPVEGPLVTTTTDGADRLLRRILDLAERRSAGRDRTVDHRWPWLLVVVDAEIEPDAGDLARLLDRCAEVGTGVSVVWLTSSSLRVPRQADVVVTCRGLLDGRPSVVTYTDPGRDQVELEIDRAPATLADRAARALAPVRDASTATSSSALPRTVALRDVLGLDELGVDDVAARWSTSDRRQLVAPIGLAATGRFVVDLVDHGPHALIGGTSGSGKSELLVTLVAGLVASQPPDAVNLLFIDYKGGASSDAFRSLPHAVGHVTNLDDHLAQRALVSLRAELDRRMGLLQGRAKDLAELVDRAPDEAPPSLVIIVDELAALVREVPDFVAGLVDIAQRGRSLGIHLVLATQRPTGTVNENILANTNLRISLRMVDGAESNSVIGSPEAALIPSPLKGRAVARLGPGALVPFQTAWAGAPAAAADGRAPVVIGALDGRWLVEVPPVGTGSNRPRQAGHRPGADGPTQLDRLLDAVAGAAAQRGHRRPRRPWRDELPLHLDAADLPPPAAPMALPIGMVDDPANQDQRPAVVDLNRGGLIVVGTGGSGKSTTLRTLAAVASADAAARGTALTIVGLDFASRQLAALTALPHTALVASGDDLEAVTRVIACCDRELAVRRAAAAGAALDGERPPRAAPVLILIDDYGALAQTFEGPSAAGSLYPWLEAVNRLIVDGRQVGIHTALTAARRASVKAAVLSSSSNRLVLRQADPAGYTDAGVPGSTAGSIDLPPGRGFLAAGRLTQVATISRSVEGRIESDDGDGTDDGQAADLRRWAAAVGSGARLGLALPALPAVVSLADLALSAAPGPTALAVGLTDLDLDTAFCDVAHDDVVIVGEPRSGRSTALATLAVQLIGRGHPVWAVGSAGSPLAAIDRLTGAAFGRGADVAPVVAEAAEAGRHPCSGRFGVLVVDDVDLLDDPAFDAASAAAVGAGVRLAVSTTTLRVYSTNRIVQELKRIRTLLHLRPAGPRDVHETIGVHPPIRPGMAMGPGRGVLVANREPVVVQVARPWA